MQRVEMSARVHGKQEILEKYRRKIQDFPMTELAIYLPGFIAAYSILLVGALSPGPSVAMLIGIATSEGRAPALLAAPGIALGSVTINILTILGVGLVLS